MECRALHSNFEMGRDLNNLSVCILDRMKYLSNELFVCVNVLGLEMGVYYLYILRAVGLFIFVTVIYIRSFYF